MRSSHVVFMSILCLLAGRGVSRADSVSALKVISKAKPIVQQDEVTPRPVRFSMLVLRVRFAADGTWEINTVSSPTALSMLSHRISMTQDSRDENGDTLHHLSIEFLPTKPLTPIADAKGDMANKTLDLKGTFSVEEQSDHFRREQPIQGRILPGKKLIVGLTDATDPKIRAAVIAGHFPTNVRSPITIYYLHITPSLITDPFNK